ncbi:hypothetical protein QWY16_18975 [Planococcus shenhongbingii]|uniref:hypothetical protein n=1 Tax=Planococcus shenhongbingii TaxID=3058398 RepID=UPI002628B93F|nr:hypothetical protein [Planococcus sp. N016]WKA58548.1 hypothetical protein QWY16_18975 [Planococcus sp. N016]
MEIAYPFMIYKNAEDNLHLADNKPLIHLNTLAQICFRAFSQTPDFSKPEIIILDHQAVEGISQPGRFEIDFDHNYFKKVGEISSELEKGERFRLGLLHKKNADEKQVIESYKKAVLLHGELATVLENRQVDSKETAIQWITD